MVTSAVALRAPVVARPAALRARPARRLAVAPRANMLSDVGKYLSEAASQIFYPQENNMPWKGSGTPFTGGRAGRQKGGRGRVQGLQGKVRRKAALLCKLHSSTYLT